jgi:hypothetical protein
MLRSKYELPAIAIALLVSLAVYAIEFDTLARSALVEITDLAANAIQITNAKSFRELYGNYSRWHFHHPGPAFFYWYALGEKILYDGLRVVASPHAAHLLAGVFLQTFFTAAGVLVIGRHVGLKWFVPFAAVFCIAYFSLAQGAFFSIWAPHALYGPTVAFIAACASVSTGRARAAPLLALSAVFLCHGHVAQPLFVLPLTCLAVAGYAICGNGFRQQLRADRVALALTAAIIAIGLWPLLLDAAKGSDSNLARIFEHLRTSEDPGHSLEQSVVYLLGFLVAQPEGFFIPESPDFGYTTLGAYLTAHAIAFSAIAAALLLGAVFCGREPFRPGRFALHLMSFVAAALLLGIYWATIQSGPLLVFNSYFLMSILLLAYMIPVIALARRFETADWRTGGAVLAAGIVATAWWAPPRYAASRWAGFVNAPGFSAQLLGAVTRNGVPLALLVFDDSQWTAATTVANVLHRAGITVLIPHADVRFRREHVRPPGIGNLQNIEFGPKGSGIDVPGTGFAAIVR